MPRLNAYVFNAWDAHHRALPCAAWASPFAWAGAARSLKVQIKVQVQPSRDWLDGGEALDALRWRLLALACYTRGDLAWLLCTRQSSAMRALFDRADLGGLVRAASAWFVEQGLAPSELTRSEVAIGLSQLWLGVAVSNQGQANAAVLDLLDVPAEVAAQTRRVLCEPVEGIDLTQIRFAAGLALDGLRGQGSAQVRPRIRWVAARGLSGLSCRPSHPAWFRGLRDQCVGAAVPFAFLDWGDWAPKGTAPEVTITDVAHYGVLSPDGKWYPTQTGWNGRAEDPDTGEASMRKVGAVAAGCLLDGRTWTGVPR